MDCKLKVWSNDFIEDVTILFLEILLTVGYR